MILKDHPITRRAEQTGYGYKSPAIPFNYPKLNYINACDVCQDKPNEAVIEDKGTKLCEKHAEENGIKIF